MGTDKLEQHIRTKLNEREIAPSKAAWSKISKELEHKQSSRKSAYFWMGIAASVVMLVGTTVLVFNPGVKETGRDLKVVDGPAREAIEKINGANLEQGTPGKDNAIVQQEAAEEHRNRLPGTKAVPATTDGEKAVVLDADVAVLDDGPKEVRGVLSPIIVSEAILDLKITEVIAQVDALERNKQVTDAEVDSLLQKAQQDILREKLFNTDYSVNAMALLTAVEEELDQSFRDQIFESLKTKFLKVRTAVADRNN